MINTNLYSINLPARIITYYPENQTADIQICAERIASDAENDSEVVVREPLLEVPVHTPSGGGWAMTMPIKAGDTCILFFSQIGYDHWLYEDKDTAGTLAKLPKPWLQRKFSEDDGYALVGLNTLPRAIQSYSAVDSQWRNSDATQIIDLREDLSIVITSPVSITINAPECIVNAPSTTVNSDTTTVNATVQADVVAPITNITSSTSVTLTTPMTTMTGNCAVLGALAVTGGIGGGGAAPASGMSVVGESVVTGGDLTVDGVGVKTHIHSTTVTGGSSAGSYNSGTGAG